MDDSRVREQLQEMLGGFWISRLLQVVAELGVADHLDQGPRSIDELARAVDVHPGRLGTPEDVGNVVTLFCSEQAACMTGQVVYADGPALEGITHVSFPGRHLSRSRWRDNGARSAVVAAAADQSAGPCERHWRTRPCGDNARFHARSGSAMPTLPRLQGRRPRRLAAFDFPNDEKAAKRTARVMLRMVFSINNDLLKDIGEPRPEAKVTCYTCHHGEKRPLTRRPDR